MTRNHRVKVSPNKGRYPKGEDSVNVKQNRSDPPECDRVDVFLQGLILVLQHHDATKDVILSFREQMTTYLSVESEEVFVKRAKYLILLPMAIYLKNELPKVPDEPLTFTGAWKKWSRPRLQVYNKKNTHLWYSFLQGKRAAAPVSSEIVLSNFRKHREQMQTPDPVEVSEESEKLKDRIMELLEPLLDLLSRQITEDLQDFFVHPEREVHKASESACYTHSRKNGGQTGALREEILNTDDFVGLREQEYLHNISHSVPFVEKDGVVKPNQYWTDRERPGELAELEEHLMETLEDFSLPCVLQAQVEAVLEPLKVRTISKGEAAPYYLGKRVQKALHTRMRELPAFKLIGQPFCPTDLMDLKECHHLVSDVPLSESYWLSVDYSSATDGLSAALSAEILDRLLRDLAPTNMRLYYLLKSVLAPHFIHYPPLKVAGPDGKKSTIQVPSVLQKNGQLMGSILSFPILCLANFGLYCAVRSDCSSKRLSLNSLLRTVLINGDDCIYIGNRTEWDIHHLYGALIGLVMSPGKAYIHKSYANINSQCVDFPLVPSRTLRDIELEVTILENEIEYYRSALFGTFTNLTLNWLAEPSEFDWEEQFLLDEISEREKRKDELLFTISKYEKFGEPKTHPLLIPYFNVGLFVGNHKVLDRVGGSSPLSKVAREPTITVMNDVIEGSLPSKKADVFKLYIARHRDAIKREAAGRNLFLPISLGGFGVRPVTGINITLTPSQLTLLTLRISTSGFLVPLIRPLALGREIRSVEDRLHDPIQVMPENASSGARLPKKLSHEVLMRPENWHVEWGLYRRL